MKYSVWYGIDGCLPEQDYPLFESNNYRECISFIANERREFVAEFGKPSNYYLYNWYIDEDKVTDKEWRGLSDDLSEVLSKEFFNFS